MTRIVMSLLLALAVAGCAAQSGVAFDEILTKFQTANLPHRPYLQINDGSIASNAYSCISKSID